jgi:hypothetical protein
MTEASYTSVWLSGGGGGAIRVQPPAASPAPPQPHTRAACGTQTTSGGDEHAGESARGGGAGLAAHREALPSNHSTTRELVSSKPQLLRRSSAARLCDALAQLNFMRVSGSVRRSSLNGPSLMLEYVSCRERESSIIVSERDRGAAV